MKKILLFSHLFALFIAFSTNSLASSTSKPVAKISSEETQKIYICSNPSCKALLSKAKKCSRCQRVVYCNQDCQKAHWKAHKRICGKDPRRGSTASIKSTPELPKISERMAAFLSQYNHVAAFSSAPSSKYKTPLEPRLEAVSKFFSLKVMRITFVKKLKRSLMQSKRNLVTANLPFILCKQLSTVSLT